MIKSLPALKFVLMIFEQLKSLIHGNSQVGTSSWMNVGYNSIFDLGVKIASIINRIGKCKWNLNVVFIAKVSQSKSDSAWNQIFICQLVNKLNNFIYWAIYGGPVILGSSSSQKDPKEKPDQIREQ